MNISSLAFIAYNKAIDSKDFFGILQRSEQCKGGEYNTTSIIFSIENLEILYEPVNKPRKTESYYNGKYNNSGSAIFSQSFFFLNVILPPQQWSLSISSSQSRCIFRYFFRPLVVLSSHQVACPAPF